MEHTVTLTYPLENKPKLEVAVNVTAQCNVLHSLCALEFYIFSDFLRFWNPIVALLRSVIMTGWHVKAYPFRPTTLPRYGDEIVRTGMEWNGIDGIE